MSFFKLFILPIAIMLSAGSTFGSTICAQACPPDQPGGGVVENPTYQYNIFVDGNLFLDSSIFGDGHTLNFTSAMSIKAGLGTFIYGYEFLPFAPNLSALTVFTNPSLSMSELGDVLLFSSVPIASGSYAATGNIYIGNYSALMPVPIPASAWLFSSGLALVGAARQRKIA